MVARSSPILHRAKLYGAFAGGRGLLGPVEGSVEIRSLDHPEASHLLLGLGRGAVGHRHGVPGTDHGRRGGRLETSAEDPGTGSIELLVEGVHLGTDALRLGGGE